MPLKHVFFLASASTLPGLVVKTESGGGGSPNNCCVGTPLRLPSTIGALKSDSRVKLIGVCLEEGGVTSSSAGEENGLLEFGG